jgi:hypothetical protein
MVTTVLLAVLFAACTPVDGATWAATTPTSRVIQLAAAETTPAASCDEILDAVLRLGPYAGVTYDADDGKWAFVGIVDDMTQYRWGNMVVDLVRVRYLYSDTIRTAWVTAGAILSPASPLYRETQTHGYLSAGTWHTHSEMRALLQPGRTYVRVYAGRDDEPVATPDGVDWTHCDTPWCTFAQDIEDLWTLEDGFSTFFAQSGMAPAWYPWGHLPWHIEVGRTDVNWCSGNGG